MIGFELQETEIHGNRVAYRMAGDGPALLLLHGITSSSENWAGVARRLARDYTVLAPDLLGHGQSAKPVGDYSMGAYASGVRDLMLWLGIERATVVGHSLGGGIAMQFAYQFPERAERLVLVSSGGLGKSVSPALRAATLPGAELVLPLLAHSRVVAVGRAIGGALARIGLQPVVDVAEAARGHASLSDPEARRAFLRTLRTSIDVTGQLVDARDRLYLAGEMPTLIVWGGRDGIIPAGHGMRAHELIPGSRLELFSQAGHFPHLDDPDRFVALLREFLGGTEAAELDEATTRELIERRRSEQQAA